MGAAEDQLMTAEQVAARWQVSQRLVYKLAKENVISAIRVGRTVRFDPKDIEGYEQNQRGATWESTSEAGQRSGWCRFQIAGQEIRRSTGTTSRRQAEVEERRLRTYFEAKAPRRGPRRGITLAELGGVDYEQSESGGAGKRRLAAVEKEWERICEFFGADAGPEAIHYDSVKAYEGWRRSEGNKGQSIVRDIWAMERGLNIAHRAGFLPKLPDELPKIKRDPKSRRLAGKLHPPAKLAAWFEQLRQRPELLQKGRAQEEARNRSVPRGASDRSHGAAVRGEQGGLH